MILGGDLVREARRRSGLTQKELAERAGTTQSAIARLESGRTSPSFELVQQMLRHCGFSMIPILDPYDDSDIAQAEAILRMPIDDRNTYLKSVVQALRAMRDDVVEQHGAA